MSIETSGKRNLFLLLMFLFFSSPVFISCNILNDKDTAVRVNDQRISQKEFSMIVAKELEDAAMSFKRYGRELKFDTPEGKTIAEKIRTDIKDRLVERLIILDASVKKNYKVDDKEVDKAFNDLKTKFGEKGYKQFVDKYKEFGVDDNYIKTDIGKQITVQKYMTDLFKDIKIDQKEIEDYFKANKQKYDRPEMVKASHILLKTEQEAKDVLKELKKGADFAELAVKRSIDPSAQQNKGNLDFFPRGVMDKDFENVAFSLPVGKMSDVVKTRFGYHVIKVVDKAPGKDATVDEAKESIISTLTVQKKTELLKKTIEELKKTAKIEIKIATEEAANDKANVEKK